MASGRGFFSGLRRPFVLPLFLSDFRLNLLGKFLPYAIVAIGIDLVWGYTGILTPGARRLLQPRRLLRWACI